MGESSRAVYKVLVASVVAGVVHQKNSLPSAVSSLTSSYEPRGVCDNLLREVWYNKTRLYD